jgi:hypothetical protein
MGTTGPSYKWKNMNTDTLTGITLQRFNKIKQSKLRAFKNVVDIAIFALENHSRFAFELIRNRWIDYEHLAAKEDRYVRKYAPDQYGYTYVLLTYKNIKDVYWQLSAVYRKLWDAIPELKAWKDKYR